MSITQTAGSSEPGEAALPRVLVADDSRVMQVAIKKILGGEFDLMSVTDGEMAWEKLTHDETIQVLITDIEMPALDGYGLICRIRAAEDERLRDLPVITITGAEDEETKQRAFACGATDFITKPLDAIQLMARVQACAKFDRAVRVIAEQAEALEEDSISDLLTGLPSRRYLLQRGDQDMAYARRNGEDLVLVRIDIDNFKQHYRALGDERGDALLAWVAKTLIDSARAEDTVARIAGAEFAVHANRIGLGEAAIMGERMREMVARQPFVIRGQSYPVTISLGLASLKQDGGDNLEALLRRASQRAAHVRSEGGNHLCTLIPGEAPQDVEVLTLEEVPETPVSEKKEENAAEFNFVLEEPVLADASHAAAPDTLQVADEIELPALDGIEMSGDFSDSTSIEMESGSSNDSMSVDEALELLSRGEEQRLFPYLDKLMQKLRPLIDLHDRNRR